MFDEKKVFNKGIPSLKNISISADIIQFNCAINDNKDFFKKLEEDYIELLDSIQKEFKYPFIFPNEYLQFTLDDDLNTHFCFSTDMVIKHAAQLLNCSDVLERDKEENIKRGFREAIKELKKVRTIQEFERKFPSLFEEYTNLKDMFEDYIKITNEIKFVDKMKISMLELDSVNQAAYQSRIDRIKIIEDYFKRFNYMKPKSVSFQDFIKSCSDLFSRLFNRDVIYELMEFIGSQCLNMQDYDGILDEDKLSLLIADASLSCAFHNEEFRTENFSYVTAYLDDVKDKMDEDICILTKSYVDDTDEAKDIELTRRELFKIYKKFINIHPEVEIIHANRDDFEGYTLDGIQEYLEKYKKDIEVSWEILPASEKHETSYDSLSGSPLSDEEKTRLQESKERIFDEKSIFFESHKPYCVIKGCNSFDGYIGYIYPNGKVILDKYYDVNVKKNGQIGSKSIASAAYFVMDVGEFVELSRKSRTEIIKDHLCPHHHHKGEWQEKVEEYIKGEITPETLEDVQGAVKRLQYTK